MASSTNAPNATNVSASALEIDEYALLQEWSKRKITVYDFQECHTRYERYLRNISIWEDGAGNNYEYLRDKIAMWVAMPLWMEEQKIKRIKDIDRDLLTMVSMSLINEFTISDD
jgi:hypothetical protein